MKPLTNKEYLGDSVYLSFDHGRLVLTTENGFPDDPSNTIFLDDIVFARLKDSGNDYFDKLFGRKLTAKD